jgi:hypothetical protein
MKVCEVNNRFNNSGWPSDTRPPSSRPEGGLILKKQAIMALVLSSLLIPLSAIYVYAQGRTLIRNAKIPFDFSVNDKTFPAGVYSVTRVNPEKIMLRLNSEDGGEAIHILTVPLQANESPKTAKLIFNRYEETYFLSQIWESGETQGHKLLKSRTERSVERDLAKRGEGPAIVDIVFTP